MLVILAYLAFSLLFFGAGLKKYAIWLFKLPNDASIFAK